MGFAVTKNFKKLLTSFYGFVYPCVHVPYMVKTSLLAFPSASMIKRALKKHGTTWEHAIDAKKIVFLKDNFIYYSYSY